MPRNRIAVQCGDRLADLQLALPRRSAIDAFTVTKIITSQDLIRWIEWMLERSKL